MSGQPISSRGSVKGNFIGTDGDREGTVKRRNCKPTDRSNFSTTRFIASSETLKRPSAAPVDVGFPAGARPQFLHFSDKQSHMTQCILASPSANCFLEACSDSPRIF